MSRMTSVSDGQRNRGGGTPMTQLARAAASLIGGLLLLIVASSSALAEPPPTTQPQADARTLISRSWDGGSCEARVTPHPSGNGCSVGREARAVVAAGKLEIYDSYPVGFVGCGETVEVCDAPFRCRCPAPKGPAVQRRRTRTGARDAGDR
jgi:hypothetical protein